METTHTINQPFRFVGQFGVMSEANGFFYMRARYYDPNVGRSISEDQTGFEGGDVNLMAYVGNQPINGIDPSGLELMRGLPNFVNPFTAPSLSGIFNHFEGWMKIKQGVAVMNDVKYALDKKAKEIQFGQQKDVFIIYGTKPARFIGLVDEWTDILKTPDDIIWKVTVEGTKGAPVFSPKGCYPQ